MNKSWRHNFPSSPASVVAVPSALIICEMLLASFLCECDCYQQTRAFIIKRTSCSLSRVSLCASISFKFTFQEMNINLNYVSKHHRRRASYLRFLFVTKIYRIQMCSMTIATHQTRDSAEKATFYQLLLRPNKFEVRIKVDSSLSELRLHRNLLLSLETTTRCFVMLRKIYFWRIQ